MQTTMTHDSTVIGTAGGTLLALLSMPPAQTIITTLITATIGAITSFVISWILKEIVVYFKNKRKNKKNGG